MARIKSANIAVHITPALSHMELLQYDVNKGSFVQLDSAPVMFDPATRENLEDIDTLKGALRRLYEKNKIPLTSPSTLVFPSFFTRQYIVPDAMPEGDMSTLLVSEAERFYVFKKITPVVGYTTLKSGQILYTAYPERPFNQLKQCFDDLKIPLVSIDCSVTCALRGLVAMGIVAQEVTEYLKWGVVIISDFNVFMAVMDGYDIEKTLEAPLAMQMGEDSAALNEIMEDFQQFFSFQVLNRMVFINNALKLFSPVLIDKLGYEGNTDIFDQNSNTLTSLGADEAPFPCSLEVIGGALVDIVPEITALQMADPAVRKSLSSGKFQTMVSGGIIALGILMVALSWGIGALLGTWAQQETAKTTTLQAEINQSLNSLSVVPIVKQKLYAKQAGLMNGRISNLLIKIAQSLPPDAWFNTLSVKATTDFKQGINTVIAGGTLSSDPLNTFITEINAELAQYKPNKPVTPSVIPQNKNNQRYFDYTLTNIVPAGAGATP